MKPKPKKISFVADWKMLDTYGRLETDCGGFLIGSVSNDDLHEPEKSIFRFLGKRPGKIKLTLERVK